MHTNTLIFAAFGAALAITLSMSMVFWTRRTYAGFGYWLSGSACRVLAVALFLLPRDQFPPWLTMVLPNYFLFAELLLYLRGTLVFRGQTANYRWEIAASATFIALITYFIYFAPSLNARVVVTSLSHAALEGWIVWQLLTRRPPYFGSIDRWQAGVWGCLGAVGLSRACYILIFSPPPIDPFVNPPAFLSMAILFMLTASLLIAMSQVIMNAQRLEYDLRISQEQLQQEIAERKHYEIELLQARDVAEQANRGLQVANAQLNQFATTDVLTGAWNRRHFKDVVVNEMKLLKRYGQPLSLMAIDIDFFKKINDVYGHAAGDQVLVRLVAVIQSTLRQTDFLSRWGGEEVIVLTPHETLENAARGAERLREAIARTVFPVVEKVTVSIGLAECLPGESLEQWLERADAALYRAKAAGRNQIKIAPETPQRAGIGDNVARSVAQLN